MSVAPVCPVSRSQALPGMPGALLPYTPKPVDLFSAIAAVNQIARILQQVVAPAAPNNVSPLPGQSPVARPGTSGPAQDGGKSLPKKQHSDWTELSRTTRRVRYYNPEDDLVWVEVERIARIVWVDKRRGTSLTFEYGNGSE